MSNILKEDWEKLLEAVAEVQEWFPEGMAFIGGIAVFAHVSASKGSGYATMSHDADFVIDKAGLGDLRDLEEMTVNRRLGKQQFVKNGFEFDVYVEGQTDLLVPVDEILAWADIRHNLRVACPEHLLVLKMKAFENRKGTSKGQKDEDDILRLVLFTQEWRVQPLARLDAAAVSEIARIVKSDALLRMVNGNAHMARQIRTVAEHSFATLRKAHAETPDLACTGKSSDHCHEP